MIKKIINQLSYLSWTWYNWHSGRETLGKNVKVKKREVAEGRYCTSARYTTISLNICHTTTGSWLTKRWVPSSCIDLELFLVKMFDLVFGDWIRIFWKILSSTNDMMNFVSLCTWLNITRKVLSWRRFNFIKYRPIGTFKYPIFIRSNTKEFSPSLLQSFDFQYLPEFQHKNWEHFVYNL